MKFISTGEAMSATRVGGTGNSIMASLTKENLGYYGGLVSKQSEYNTLYYVTTGFTVSLLIHLTWRQTLQTI
jgi:hypothetical protein